MKLRLSTPVDLQALLDAINDMHDAMAVSLRRGPPCWERG
jgi:hypothetical protein